MYTALRLVSVERGVDPRDFWLMCYGGAGGLHAAALADELGARGIIVPLHPGLFSAYGLLISDLQRDWSTPFLRSVNEIVPDDLRAAVHDLREAAVEEWVGVGRRPEEICYRLSLDMRYPGQGFEVEVRIAEQDLLSPEMLATAFHEAHRKRYGHAAEHEDPEVVNVRLSAVIPRREEEPPWVPDQAEESKEFEAYVNGESQTVAFLAWNGLATDEVVPGPAVVREATSTVWIPAGWNGHLDAHGHLHMERSEG